MSNMMNLEQVKAATIKLVAMLKTADVDSQHLVASACAQAIINNNGVIVNDVIEAIQAVNSKHRNMALQFAKDNFPLVAIVFKSVVNPGTEVHGVKYSKKTHEDKFAGLSGEDMYNNAMKKPYVLEKERKEVSKKTLAEKHAAALKIIEKCEKDVPNLREQRFQALPMTVESLMDAIKDSANTLSHANLVRILAAAEAAVRAAAIEAKAA